MQITADWYPMWPTWPWYFEWYKWNRNNIKYYFNILSMSRIWLPFHHMDFYTTLTVCTPPQTTIPIIHCTDDTHTEHTADCTNHTADCTDHTAYLSHGLPLCHCFSILQMLATTKPSRVVLLCCVVLCCVCVVLCCVVLCCVVLCCVVLCCVCCVCCVVLCCVVPDLLFVTWISLCLALWILFADRRPRPFTWVLFCLALYMTVCHLFDPACVFEPCLAIQACIWIRTPLVLSAPLQSIYYLGKKQLSDSKALTSQ